jgi:site-specific DNA-cytosine methylase
MLLLLLLLSLRFGLQDLFGGIGSTIVSLKRLGVAMCKIIHCEHDKVANHVFKYNHDVMYTPNLMKIEDEESSCQYVYYETFEQVEKQIEDIVKEHGRTLEYATICVDMHHLISVSKIAVFSQLFLAHFSFIATIKKPLTL